MSRSEHPHHWTLRNAIFFTLLAFSLIACKLSDESLSSEPQPVTVTPTITSTPIQVTETPAVENCYWNWAYGEGSPDFDLVIMQKLNAIGIQITVSSSSFGETNSCDQSFHAKDLDVSLEIQVPNFEDPSLLTGISEFAFRLLQENLSVSSISNLGKVNLTFINLQDNATCNWDWDFGQCNR